MFLGFEFQFLKSYVPEPFLAEFRIWIDSNCKFLTLWGCDCV